MSQIKSIKNLHDAIFIDTIGGFENYGSNKRYLHIAIDAFSRHVWHICSKNRTAKNFIILIQKQNNPMTNFEKTIITDRYSANHSKEFRKCIQNLHESKIIYTFQNTPHSLGLCERVNRTLINRLRCRMAECKPNTRMKDEFELR